MEQHHRNGIYQSYLIGLIVTIWQSIPIVVKIYLGLVSVRVIVAIARSIVQGSGRLSTIWIIIVKYTAALCAILFFWWLGEASVSNVFGDVTILASKLVVLWFGVLMLAEILDDLSAMGLPIPSTIRDHFKFRHNQNGGKNGESKGKRPNDSSDSDAQETDPRD